MSNEIQWGDLLPFLGIQLNFCDIFDKDTSNSLDHVGECENDVSHEYIISKEAAFWPPFETEMDIMKPSSAKMLTVVAV